MSLLLHNERDVLRRWCRKNRGDGGSNLLASEFGVSRQTVSKMMNGGSVDSNLLRDVRAWIIREVSEDPSLIASKTLDFESNMQRFLLNFGFDKESARSVADFATYLLKCKQT